MTTNTKLSKIPAGYRITCVSWENDGDYYNTVVREGLNKEETTLLAELAQIIKERKSGLENNYEPKKQELEKGRKILAKVFDKYPEIFKLEMEIEDMLEYICDNITGNSEEGYALRVLESMKIDYFPHDIFIEDVTAEFFHNK